MSGFAEQFNIARTVRGGYVRLRARSSILLELCEAVMSGFAEQFNIARTVRGGYVRLRGGVISRSISLSLCV